MVKKITVDDLEGSEMYNEFKELHKDQLLEWVKQHPNSPPPIYYNNKTNEFSWLSRKDRRRLGIK